MVERIKETNEEIRSAIADEIALRISDWFGSDTKFLRAKGGLRRNQNSFFLSYHMMNKQGEKKIFAKIPRKKHMQTLCDAIHDDELRGPTVDEYKTLQSTWEIFNDADDQDCHALEPLMYFEKWNAIIMPELEGKMFKKILLSPGIFFRNSASWAKLRVTLRKVSHWLRLFHAGNKLSYEKFPLDEAQLQIETALNAIKHNSNGKADLDWAIPKVNELLMIASKETVPMGLLHDDYQYSNIMVLSDDRVCALDPRHRRYGPVYADLSTLIVDPQLRLVQILTAGRAFPDKYLDLCQQDVLSNYFHETPSQTMVLNFYCVLACLQKWAFNEKILASGRLGRLPLISLISTMVRRQFSKTLLKYLN